MVCDTNLLLRFLRQCHYPNRVSHYTTCNCLLASVPVRCLRTSLASLSNASSENRPNLHKTMDVVFCSNTHMTTWVELATHGTFINGHSEKWCLSSCPCLRCPTWKLRHHCCIVGSIIVSRDHESSLSHTHHFSLTCAEASALYVCAPSLSCMASAGFPVKVFWERLLS